MFLEGFNLCTTVCFIGIFLNIVCLPQTTSEQCSRSVRFSETKSVTVQGTSSQKYTVKCGFWSLSRCTKYRTGYFNCPECSEWKFASDLCQNGGCTSCQSCECNQANSDRCHKRDGTCFCKTGWHGNTCEYRCEQGLYGNGCSKTCPCVMNNTVSCNHDDGKCNCEPGWIGKTCNTTCNQGMYGQGCTENCTCVRNNTISCDHDDGTCNCKPGWMGVMCNQTCSSHTYDQHCNHNCTCNLHNTESCDSKNGTCYCKSGWMGLDCNDACSNGWYGDGCQDRCLCMSNTTVTCDQFNGTCYCKPGWTGVNCDKTINACSNGWCDGDSQVHCLCIYNTTVTCDQFNGTCYCKPGWTGMYCNETIHDDESGDTSFHEGGRMNSGGVVAGIVVVVLVLIVGVVAVIIFILWKRRRKNEKSSGDSHTLSTLQRSDREETSGIEHDNAYANVCNNDGGDEKRPDNIAKPSVYAMVNKKPKLKAKSSEKSSTGDHPNCPVGDEYSVIVQKAKRDPLDDKSDDVNDGSVQATDSYSVLDRSGKAYRQNHLQSDTSYDNLGTQITGNKPETTDKSIDDSYSGVDRTGKAYRPAPEVAEIEYDNIKSQANESRPLQNSQAYDHLSRNVNGLDNVEPYGQAGQSLSSAARRPMYENVGQTTNIDDRVEYEIQ